MLPSHEEYISSLFKSERFLNEGKYQHFWDLHWLQRSFWTPELPKECIALSLFPNSIPIYCTEFQSQSWPAREAWKGVKILADTSRNQLPHAEWLMSSAGRNTDVQEANLGQVEQSRWAQTQHLKASTCWVWCTGLCNPCDLGERISRICVVAAQSCDCEPLSAAVEKSFHLPAPRESPYPCLPLLLSFSQPGDAVITISRILWFVPKVQEIKADMGDGIWRLANLRTHFVVYLIPLRRAEVAWIPSDVSSPEEEKRLHLLKQIIFETNFNTLLLTLELKGSCYRMHSSIGVWVTVILLNTGANLLLCPAKKDVRLCDAVPDPNMHPTTSLSPHCCVPDPHCASPGS